MAQICGKKIHEDQPSFLPLAKPAGQWMIFVLSFFLSVKICQTEHYRGQRSTGTSVIEANEFKYEVRSDLGFKKPDTAD